MDTFIQILFFVGLMVLMMRFGCGSHMFKKGAKDGKEKHGGHGGGCCGGGHKKHADVSPSEEDADVSLSEEEGQKLTPPNQQIDPVCGMAVSTEGAKSSFHDGLIYFFCSETCRTDFEASPERYVGDTIPEKRLK